MAPSPENQTIPDGLPREGGQARTTLHALVEHAPFAVHLYELIQDIGLRFIGANAAADRLFGVDHASLAGKWIEEAFHALRGTRIPEEYARIAREGGTCDNTPYPAPGGASPTPLEAHAFRPAPGITAVFFHPVMEQGRAHALLLERIDALNRHFLLGLDMLCNVDAQGNVRTPNPEWEKILGWALNELEGRPLLDIVHSDDHGSVRGVLERLRGEDRNEGCICRCRCRDGSHRWVEWRMSSHGSLVYAAARDISDRMLMQEQIVERQQRLASILRAAPIGIGVVVNRVITEANNRLHEITGYPAEELLGLPTRRFYATTEEHRRVGQVLVQEGEREGFTSLETRWIRKDGSPVDILLNAAPLEPRDPAVGITITVQDITERRRVESERRTLEERMLHAQKLESLGVLAGGIAHDFNNILMAVLGNADLAQSELEPHSPARENIAEIEKATFRAAELCRQLLAYSGKGRYVIQPLDLNKLIREMEHILRVSVSKKTTLHFRFSPHLPAIDADAAQLRQVIMNLVVNASEALDEANGIITLTTGAQDCDRAYLRTVYLDENLPEGRYIFLDVTDNGHGMDPDTRRRIFEPFFSTKFTGRGLGLAAVLGIVRSHKGTIKVYTERGKGSSFKVLLPAGRKTQGPPGGAGGGAPPWKGSGLVLLADDDESVRYVAQQMLERLGFDVILARDGKQALQLYAQHPGELACVIMDLNMPEMDGEEAFREIRRIDPEARVFLSSGYNEQEAVTRFVGRGLAGFLQKPYQLADLEARLKATLSRDP